MKSAYIITFRSEALVIIHTLKNCQTVAAFKNTSFWKGSRCRVQIMLYNKQRKYIFFNSSSLVFLLDLAHVAARGLRRTMQDTGNMPTQMILYHSILK